MTELSISAMDQKKLLYVAGRTSRGHNTSTYTLENFLRNHLARFQQSLFHSIKKFLPSLNSTTRVIDEAVFIDEGVISRRQ